MNRKGGPLDAMLPRYAYMQVYSPAVADPSRKRCARFTYTTNTLPRQRP